VVWIKMKNERGKEEDRLLKKRGGVKGGDGVMRETERRQSLFYVLLFLRAFLGCGRKARVEREVWVAPSLLRLEFLF
jgi:hypothetical protein